MKFALSLATAVLAVCAALAVLAPHLPLTPEVIELPKILLEPSREAWFGYDDLGRSVGDRLAFALRTSMYVAALVVPLSAAIGVFIGMTAAWCGGYADSTTARVMDVFLAFPGTLLAIALAGLLGPGIGNVVVALTIVGWAGFARLARAQTHAVKTSDHVQAAQVLGASTSVTLMRHVLPLIAGPILVEATLGVAGVIVAEAGLSFLGLGVQAPAASLGAMLRDGTAYMLVAPHLVIAPGGILVALVLSVNVLGETLQRRLNPKSTILLLT